MSAPSREILQTVEKYQAVAEFLGELSERALAMPDDKAKGVAMALSLLISQAYVIDCARHLFEGMEPYDALRAAARGDTPLSPSQADMLRAVMPIPTSGGHEQGAEGKAILKRVQETIYERGVAGASMESNELLSLYDSLQSAHDKLP